MTCFCLYLESAFLWMWWICATLYASAHAQYVMRRLKRTVKYFCNVLLPKLCFQALIRENKKWFILIVLSWETNCLKHWHPVFVKPKISVVVTQTSIDPVHLSWHPDKSYFWHASRYPYFCPVVRGVLPDGILYLWFPVHVVGKLDCDFAQINSEKILVNFSSCHPLAINLCTYWPDREQSIFIRWWRNFQLCWGPGSPCFNWGPYRDIYMPTRKPCPEKLRKKIFKRPSTSRNDSTFFIDMLREDQDPEVLYSQNIAVGPYCEVPEFRPYH